jgi:hypothetical protein
MPIIGVPSREAVAGAWHVHEHLPDLPPICGHCYTPINLRAKPAGYKRGHGERLLGRGVRPDARSSSHNWTSRTRPRQ